MNSLGSTNIDCRQDGSAIERAFGRASYLFNPTIAGIEDADALVMIGADPRHEAGSNYSLMRRAIIRHNRHLSRPNNSQ
jgi:NADH-quinone oxidoreductase subunit G